MDLDENYLTPVSKSLMLLLRRKYKTGEPPEERSQAVLKEFKRALGSNTSAPSWIIVTLLRPCSNW
jgi:hypothetical protein